MAKSELSPKQERFCQEYLIDLNGAQAAIRAGYSKAAAKEMASRLLTKAHIRSRIEKLQAKISDKLGISVERVLNEYRKLAFLDIRKAFSEDGDLKPVADLDDDTAASVAGIEFEEVFERDANGKREHVGRIHKIKLSNKLGALDSLAKYHGIFTDKVELTGEDGGPLKIVISQDDAEL